MYQSWLCCVWGALPLAVTASFGCLAAGTWLLATASAPPVVGGALLGAGAALMAYRVVYGARGATARTLSGAYPCFSSCFGAPAPSSLDELEAAIRRTRVAANVEWQPPEVVGSGWGFWTMRRSARARRIHTHRLVGQNDPNEPLGFLAGTTIFDTVKTLRTHRMCLKKDPDDGVYKPSTFWSHPSISNIALGGWFSVSGHGNAGDAGHPSSHCLREGDGVEVWNMRKIVQGEARSSFRQMLGYKELRALMDTATDRKDYIVVRVRFDRSRLAINHRVQKRLVVLNSAVDASKWLELGAELRVLFVGTGRSVGLGIRWEKVYNEMVTRPCFPGIGCLPMCRTKHVDEHDCSRECRAFQSDTCTAVGGWYEKVENSWRGISTLASANLWTPLYTPPIGPLLVMCQGVYNFEIICQFPPGQPLTGERLFQIVGALGSMLGAPGVRGRCEVRYGSPENNVFFLDSGINRAGFHIPFKLLRDYGITQVALHTGKYQGQELQAIAATYVALTTPYDIYYGPRGTQAV